MESALIVSSTENGRQFIAGLLKSNSIQYVTVVSSGNEARRLLLDTSFNLIVINSPLQDEFGHELALQCADCTNSGILMLVKAEMADDISAKVEDYGVFVVSKPVNRQFFFQSLKLVIASYKRVRGLQNENVKLLQKIDEIRLVDRAKCSLIQYLNMTEAQAHRYIEKQAMDLRITRREVAENILKTYESY